ncbi:MAG TPA: hypothetical protein VM266_03600 [Solirubrobacteraceae bacterium]|nr:hypothetical protein [Solirubrobacteraceae bacterium]
MAIAIDRDRCQDIDRDRFPAERGVTRVGINGFGRMGRLALRAAWGGPVLGSRTSTSSTATQRRQLTS